jgi:RHS repeat-associated protein
MMSARLWMLLGVMLAGNFSAFAQNNPNEEQGLKPYDSFHGGDLDSVSLTSGGLSLHIPLASFPQRGNLDLSFMVSFSNKQWYVTPARYGTNGTVLAPAQWLPMPNTGAQIVSSTDWWLNTCSQVEMDPNNPQTLYDWSDSVSSPDGNSHVFGALTGASSPPIFPMRSADNTGLLRPDAHTLILPNGTRYVYPSGSTCAVMKTGQIVRGGIQASSITDANGNQITTSTSGWTDTMGRFIPGAPSTVPQGIQPGINTTDLSKCPSGTASARIWNVPGISTINGGTRTFYFCYATFSLYTAFPATTGANNYGPVNTPLLSAIVLPDLTMWTFTYDNYGDVLSATFPTRGSLAYTYATGPLNSTSDTGYSTWVASRTVDANDGTGTHQWTYNFQGNFPSGSGATTYLYSQKGIATVTDPDNNDVVHTIGPGAVGSCPGYEYQTQYFQGPASGGVVLKTVQTQYDCVQGEIATNTVPIQITTISQRGETSKVINSYDPTVADAQGQYARIGSLLQRDEYDFLNTLVRSTMNHYRWQDNATYKSDNFVSAPASVTLKDGAGNQVAQTTYTYDEGTPGTSGIGLPTHVGPPAGEPYRGNLTTTSKWLNTTNSFISSTATYLDTGMKATSRDPLLNQTSYTYSPTFLGAYLTQTNLPDTQMPDSGAPVVHHVISGDYDFNTGLLLTFTDENGQPYSYTYDVMLRLTQGNHPDGGITKFLYPDPNTVERQRLITGTTYDDFKVKFDGVGRPYQTLQLTPDCASWIKVDTAYDLVGRVKTVSNPYCLTNEPTYGITQTTYDALSRTLNTTKQDGSVTAVKYDDTPGDTSGPTLVCTTATDESGKKRQACTDALGRLVKVLEQNPGAPATFASGSVAVAGTEQSTGGAATSGSGTVTISGTEQSVCDYDSCPPSPITYDSGPVSITVNGVQKSVTYSHFSTPTTIATALAAAFHNDGSAPADATSSGAVVTLTARATGAATNYSLSVAVSTSDPADFAGPSFSVAKSGGNFTGGHDGGVSDTGSVTISVNGTNYSTAFGAGDTASSIAGRLASTVNSGTLTYATASGSNVNLTSKIAGGNTNYSLSSSYTYNSGTFTQPSFTTSVSGATLAGGYDASAIPNHPFITQYQYDALGNLLCVHQKGADSTADKACTDGTIPATWRPRNFSYDSFGRLLSAYNPEAGSMTYQYDNAGNIISKVEPKPNQLWGSTQTVTVTYAYDALNRLTDKTYSDGTTQNSSYRYDYASFLGQTFTYPVGREVAATAANNASQSFTSYDQMGRVVNTVQCNPGVTGCKTFTASYDKLGDITSLTYPGNGFTVTYGYDCAARLTTATDSSGVIYAQTPTFTASGAIQEFASPNFNNNKYHVDYNNRLQPTEIWTGAAKTTALFDKQYSYGTAGANNGNIYTITNVKDSTRTQTFSYDVLNRLISAQDQTHWANTYSYDAWGNMQKIPVPNVPGEGLGVAGDANNHMLNYMYDAAGNMQNDGTNRYTFDAENHIACMNPDVNWVCNTNSISYTYDADSRRVQKSSGTNYWYGPGGQAFAETDSAGVWTNYIFFGGQRLARNLSGDIKYYITDHLHSSAMFVDKAGTTAAILDDNDMYPWGGIVPGVGKTTSNNTVKFTGQYRDGESQLDYFGARYYSNTIGRFMSPDWAAKPTTVPYAKFGDPQSLNLYSYTENGPINRIDGDGHRWDDLLQRPNAGVNDGGASGGGTPSDPITMPWIAATEFADGAQGAATQQQGARDLILVGDPGLGEHNQGGNFDRAAKTRSQELEKQGISVTTVRVSSVDDVASALKNNGTLSGVEYFGHASYDRLYVGETSAQGTNIDSSNVGKLSGVNLTKNATVAIHACFAGSGGSESIASRISQQLGGRTVTAYDGPTHFAPVVIAPNGKSYPASRGPIYLVPDRGTKLVQFP